MSSEIPENLKPENMPTITFTAGCGGSGKSTILAKMFPGLEGVDPDQIKLEMPGYDPLHPELVHAASSVKATRMFYAMLGAGRDFYFDGTGKNVEKYVGLITAAKAAGFKTRILWVRAPLATCLARNSARARKVPLEVIVETHTAVEAAQAVLKHYVDEQIVVDNP